MLILVHFLIGGFMRTSVKGMIATAAICAAVVLWVALTPAISQQAPASGQFSAYRPPRMADGHPDLNGIWQAFVSANWDLQDNDVQARPHPEINGAYAAGPAGQRVVEGGGIPYEAAALA